MKYLALSLLFLVSCATTETSTEDSPIHGSTEPAMSSDTLFAPTEPQSAVLATPVDSASSTPAEAQAVPETTLSEPTPPGPPPPPEYTPEPEAPSVASAPPASLPPVVESPGAPKGDRNIRQEYEEYKDRAQTRADAEEDFEQRSLFPHEDGAFQFGADYAYKPFSEFDFDPSTAKKNADLFGVALNFNYFPVRSLSYGRLGVGASGASYWAKFDFSSGGVERSEKKKNFITTYGGRLIYEFQYFLGQFFVPFAFYGYDKVNIRDLQYTLGGANYPKQSFNSQSYGAGAHFNLNRLESSTASKALAGSGIRKFYLTYTFLQRAESTGAGHFLGLRFEY